MVKKLLAQRKKLGSLAPLSHRCGNNAKFNYSELEWLKETIRKRPDATLKDLRKTFKKPCSTTTIFRALQKIKASYKKTTQAAEQNRADVLATVTQSAIGEWFKACGYTI